jgi:hypothetical protein
MKVCSKCKIEKDNYSFYKKKTGKNGLMSWCKSCDKLRVKDYISKCGKKIKQSKHKHMPSIEFNEKCKEYYKIHKEEILKKRKEYYIDNKNQIKKRVLKYHHENKEKILPRQREYYKNNKEKLLNNHKEFYRKNRERFSLYHKNYRQEHKEEKKIYFKNYVDNKLKTDSIYKLKKNIRGNFRSNLKYQLVNKNKCFFNYTQISFETYIEYFKINFSLEFSELTVKNKYHIDHIIPCALYDFTDEEEIKKCWMPENLRLIYGKDNMEKHSKIDFELIDKHNIRHLLPKSLINKSEVLK